MQIKTETKVGLFVIVALMILAYMANYLGAFKWNSNQYQSYQVWFKNVSGLTQKADVKISGVKVGWVESIRLVQPNSMVEVVLMINGQYQIYQDAHVNVHQDGLLGTKFIDLAPGTTGVLLPGQCLPKLGLPSASIDDLVNKFDQVAKNIDQFVTQLTPISGDLGSVTRRLDQVLDHDFNNILNNLNNNLDTIYTVGKKINDGTGSFGRLLNEPELYEDFKTTSQHVKQVFQACENVGWVVDSHLEAMAKKVNGYCYKNAKSYFGGRLHLNKDWYGLFQIVSSDQGGVVDREQIYTNYFDQAGNLLTPDELKNLGCSYAIVPPITKEEMVERNTITYSYQVGKLFGNHYAFRFGVFENYFGMALDWDIPFNNDNIRWVTTMEMFDFKGQNNLDDRRPHLKWLNKVFLFKSCYFAFGVDNFASKKTTSPFFGMGIRFGGDDYDACFKND